ncbi:MAG TPA: hypothetical protein VNK52_16285, partial [Hyphomicrobiaceae bacterium]|nr:hypothetical protein [Hyphomicrobiaceae bacterium]
MAAEDDAEMLAALRGKLRKTDRSLGARRIRETRVPPYDERRAMARTGRTEQTNLKFKPEFKKRLLALSSAAGMSMTEY